jgi:hypothetical protein
VLKDECHRHTGITNRKAQAFLAPFSLEPRAVEWQGGDNTRTNTSRLDKDTVQRLNVVFPDIARVGKDCWKAEMLLGQNPPRLEPGSTRDPTFTRVSAQVNQDRLNGPRADELLSLGEGGIPNEHVSATWARDDFPNVICATHVDLGQ